MNCPQCGNEIDPGSAFCGNCGQAISAVQPQTDQVVEEPAVSQAVPPTPVMPPTQPAPAPQPMPPSQPMPPVVMAQPVSPSQATVPAYAVPKPEGSSVKPVIGLALSILSLPGAIIPIVGLGFGVAALVLGSKSMAHKKGMATVAIVLGSIGIILSLIVFAYNLKQLH